MFANTPKSILQGLGALLIVIISIVVGVLIYEAYVRITIFNKLDQHFAAIPMWLQNQSLIPAKNDPSYGDYEKSPIP